MFTQISWGSYITIVVVVLVLYYLFIGFKYYRYDLLQILTGKKSTAYNLDSYEKENLFPLAESVSDELQAYLREAARNKIGQEEVITGLRGLLGKYPWLKDSTFNGPIENLILSESAMNAIPLDTVQIKLLWN